MRISDWSSDVCSSDLVEAVVAPAHAHLDRHRHLHRLDAGLDQRRGEFQVAHQRRTGVAIRHLAHRTAHVDVDDRGAAILVELGRSEEHTSELQSLMRISYAVFCLKKKNTQYRYQLQSTN